MEKSNLEQTSSADKRTDMSDLDAELLSRNYTLTPFTSKENSEQYDTVTFVERGIEITFLKKTKSKQLRGNKYKFGLVDWDYNFYWFFNGMSKISEDEKIKDRATAIQVYALLKRYCELKDIGTPFLYK